MGKLRVRCNPGIKQVPPEFATMQLVCGVFTVRIGHFNVVDLFLPRKESL